ncbi:MAG: hypothetical protein ABI700_24970 [Chloroflexota bacterium]
MKRMILLALVLALALILAFPAAAQSSASAWSAYLFESTSQQLTRVYSDGTQQIYDLGLGAETFVGHDAIDFAPDGNRVGYCTSANTVDGSVAALIVRDITNANPQAINLGLGAAGGCWVKFNADASQIAVGVVRYYAGDPNADASLPPWSLLVFDAVTGNQLYEMNPLKGNSIFNPAQTFMPQVRYFANNQIIFAGIPWGTEGTPSSPAYFWQLSDDSIQPIDRWWRWGQDSLVSTGELVWTELDPTRAAAEPGGPLPQANTVKLADKSGQERVIYINPDWVILDTQFIDNGRQLAINELQGADPNSSLGSQPSRWIALDRSGTTSVLATTLGFSQMLPAPDGYAILWASDNSVTPLMSLDYYSGREKTTLWQQQGNGGVTWSLLWTSPTATADGLQPFTTVSP